MRLRAAVCFAILSIVSSAAHAYVAHDLHPVGAPDSFIDGARGGQQVGAAGLHAGLWTGAAASFVNLNPAGITQSGALGTSGSTQVGYARGAATSNQNHAYLWSGTAASAIDLNPTGATESRGTSAFASQQVGEALYNDGWHALLWSGAANSNVDLHPAGFVQTFANGMDATHQVGFGELAGFSRHALLWNGSAASFVDLHPASGYIDTRAVAVSNGSQVGHGSTPETDARALLWNGTAASVVDLHPDGAVMSEALAVSGSMQVGRVIWTIGDFNVDHATLWNGTAASMVDLHAALSADYIESTATGIGDNGDIYGYASYRPAPMQPAVLHAIRWTVPEPTALVLLLPAAAGAMLRRRRRR